MIANVTCSWLFWSTPSLAVGKVRASWLVQFDCGPVTALMMVGNR